jgi:hypothetical protein
MKHIFDLDLTLWDCYNKHGDPIWAKQMVWPYHRQVTTNDILTDDVYSFCSLRRGVKEYLKHLKGEGHQIGFLSAGAYHSMPYSQQPSVRMLKMFGIYNDFDYIQVLAYKSFNKAETLTRINQPIIFYDDNQDVLNSVRDLKHVTAIDSKEILDWSNLIGIDYDRYIIRSPERL